VTTEIAVDAAGRPKEIVAVEALRGLDLRVRAGDLRHSRPKRLRGKTTFIRCVAGLLRPEPRTLTVLGKRPARRGERGFGPAT